MRKSGLNSVSNMASERKNTYYYLWDSVLQYLKKFSEVIYLLCNFILWNPILTIPRMEPIENIVTCLSMHSLEMNGKNLNFVIIVTTDKILSQNVSIHYLVTSDIIESTT